MDRIEQLVWNPFTPGYYQNPLAHLNDCREIVPIHVGSQGAITFFKYDHVSEMLRSKDYEATSLSDYLGEKEDYLFKGVDQCPYLSTASKAWPFYNNGHTHKMLRVGMMKAFNQINFKDIIQESVEVTNRSFADKDEFDFSDYCGLFIYEILKRAFDLQMTLEEMTNYSSMLTLSQDIFVPKQVYLEINKWMLWGKKIFKNSAYKDQLIANYSDISQEFDLETIYSLMGVTVMAGYETSKANLGIALLEAIRNPQLLEIALTLGEREQSILIEELFRYSSPTQFTIRVNKKPLQIEGFEIPANSKLYLCIASANHDPRKFDNPNSIQFDRSPNDHLSFGAGPHFCLGANIARTELRIGLKPMLSFLKNFKINEGSIKWKKQIIMRNLDSALMARNHA
ncbi:cytochrome P450 [Ekhidna sp.]